MTVHDFHEDEILGKAYDARLVRRLVVYLRPYRALVLLAVVFLFLYTGAQLLGPYITKVAIDRYMAAGDLHGLNLMALAYLGTIGAAFLLQFGQTYLTQYVGQRAMHDLRTEIFAHLQRHDPAFFDRNPVGRFMTRVINDVETLNDLFGSGVVTFLGDTLTLAGVAAAMLLLDWRLALVTLSLSPVLAVITQAYRRKARENYRETRKALSRMNAYLNEHISGMATVQVFGQEARTYRRFQGINARYRDAQLRSIHYNAIFFPLVEVMSAVAIGLVLWEGGRLILQAAILPGVVVAFLQYVQRMFMPIKDLAEKYNILQAAMASSERIFTLLDTPPTIRDPVTPVSLGRIRGEIEFRDVWLSYTPGEPVLKGVSFRIRPGEKVALVGATGAGKTSVISALLRFYEIDRGSIRVDGVDIREWDRRTLRRHLGLVLQDVFLFSGDIASNIGLGDPRITPDRIASAAQRVHAARFIARLPGGFAEEVQERGSTLSQGERQLLSFARALAFDPPILILDEATSNVDTETELLIQDALRELLRDRTALVIAHRLSTIQFVDRILVIHKGRLLEEGQHHDLLARGGIYARLYELQYEPQSPHPSLLPPGEKVRLRGEE